MNIMFHYQISHKPDEWHHTLTLLPNPHVLQSWAWGDFKSRWGWSVERLVWTDGHQPLAAAQVLHRAIPRTPWNFLYVPKGPLLDYDDTPLVEQVLADLEAYARQARALFIKIDPDVRRQLGEPHPHQPLDATGMAALNLLNQRGWRLSPEQIQFQNTMVIDLTPAIDDLLANMKSKWRYNIRLAERKGVSVRPGTAADLPAFYQMYADTAARDGFLIRPEAYYRDVWSRFMEAGQAELLLAQVDEEIMAGLVLFFFEQSAWYMYGASSDQYRQLMPNHALQWAAICRAKAWGCHRYDLWGAPDVFNESDRLWGVYRFKQGFGGQVVQWLGAYDFPVKRSLYLAFTNTMPRLRALLRRVKAGG